MPGETLRQVQAVASLPSWASTLQEVTDGYALAGMLDHNYAEWAEGFLTRARKRLSLPEKAPVDLFLSCAEFSQENRTLVVCVYPRTSTISEKEMETPSGVAA